MQKTTSLEISNSISPNSQKNNRILVKLNKKRVFFGSKPGLNCPQWSCHKPIRNSHIVYVYNRTIHLQVLDTQFQFMCICCSRPCLDLGPHCVHFGGFWGNNSSKRHYIELKFWTQVVLIVVQIPFQAFWKARSFTERGNVHKVSVFGPTLTPIYPLKLAKIKNSQLAIQIIQNQSPISFQLSVKTIITFCSIWTRVWLGNGSRAKDQEVTG